MFEMAEQGRSVSQEEFLRKKPDRRLALVTLQQTLRSTDFPVILVMSGIKGAGQLQVTNVLNHWMDPRWIRTMAFTKPTDEERERPPYWRYWRALPPAGQIGIFLHAWYEHPIRGVVDGSLSRAEADAALGRVQAFERALADEGALILKFWFHLSKDAQTERLETLTRQPEQGWRITDDDWHKLEDYEVYTGAAEQALRQTDRSHARWHIIEGMDRPHAILETCEILENAVSDHMQRRKKHKKAWKPVKPPKPLAEGKSVLASIDMDQTLAKENYEEAFLDAQARLHDAHDAAKAKGISTYVVFEGWDAAGKGGAIRRITSALDARDYTVVPIAAPTDEERAQHYLWRFWRQLGREGRITLFDRSWYGRVLVEWVEGFASKEAIDRAFEEINEFEASLVAANNLVLKFWLHITPEEQLKRFEKRKNTPYKAWKLTEEDWRNRDKWDVYEAAVTEMVARTSQSQAPWHLIPANDKRYARVEVMNRLAAALENAASAS